METVWNYLSDLMGNNEFLQGGFILGVMATIVRYCYSLPYRVWNFGVNHLIFSIEFDKQDSLFTYFVDWIDSINIANRKKKLRVTTRELLEDEVEEEQACEAIYSLAQGSFYIKHHIWMRITRGKADTGGDDMEGNILRALNMEKFEIETFIWNRKRLLNLIQEVYKISSEKNTDSITIKKYDYGWRLYKKQAKTKLSNVILKQGQKEDILQDIEYFIKSQSWYEKRDIPFRRGYLLCGPPGTGKTSLLVALASHLNYNLNIIDLTDFDNNKLVDALTSAEKRSITIIEDIDSFFDGRKCLLDGKSDLTFSGLLNAIDGVISSNGRILFVTTNHEEKIDDALKRNGRVDKKVVLDYLDEFQYKEMFLKFFPGKEDLAEKFLALHKGSGKVSPAKMQQLFIKHRDTPELLTKGTTKEIEECFSH